MSDGLTLEQQQQLRRLLEHGLPLTSRPYQVLAEQINSTEQVVLQHVQDLNAQGLFRRFGIVVKHRALGINANVMLVMDIEDERVHQVGAALGEAPGSIYVIAVHGVRAGPITYFAWSMGVIAKR